jgi:hypothetical protein
MINCKTNAEEGALAYKISLAPPRKVHKKEEERK